DIPTRTARFARLAVLLGVGAPPRSDDGARGPDRGTAPERTSQLLEHLEIRRLLESTAARYDHLGFGDIEGPRGRRLDLAYDHATRHHGGSHRHDLRSTRLGALDRRENVGTHRQDRRPRRDFCFL